MPKDIYQRFNAGHYSPERYQQVLAQIHELAGETVMRMCESPVFITSAYADEVIQGAKEIIRQSLAPALQEKIKQGILPEFRMPSAPDCPTFFIIDFAVTKDGPHLIEMQAFASNLLFIPAAAEIYRDVYHLGNECQHLLCDEHTIRKTILNGHAPENVVLMEINPWQQASRRDFVVTQKKLGIPVVDVTEIIQEGIKLFYKNERGQTIPIHRIYNRVIPTEFQNLKLAEKTQFKFTDELDVEWAGDPGWFLKISKYVLPFLEHRLVPETCFLDEIAVYPPNLENYVLKPVFFNAGIGVKIDVSKSDLDAIPATERHNYILMQKVTYEPFIPDPNGNMLNAELRIMFVWPEGDELQPSSFSVRVMRGNDVNANLKQSDENNWCGLAPVFIV